jgi:hypothetical protein
MIEELRESFLTRKKAEVLLQRLEELKENISEIETKYNILQADYADICQNAIAKINILKEGLREEIGEKVGDLDLFEPTITNIEARRKLGIFPEDTRSGSPDQSQELNHKPNVAQRGVDKIASGIECSLDAIGNVIIFIGEGIIRLILAPFRIIRNRNRIRIHY